MSPPRGKIRKSLYNVGRGVDVPRPSLSLNSEIRKMHRAIIQEAGLPVLTKPAKPTGIFPLDMILGTDVGSTSPIKTPASTVATDQLATPPVSQLLGRWDIPEEMTGLCIVEEEEMSDEQPVVTKGPRTPKRPHPDDIEKGEEAMCIVSSCSSTNSSPTRHTSPNGFNELFNDKEEVPNPYAPVCFPVSYPMINPTAPMKEKTEVMINSGVTDRSGSSVTAAHRFRLDPPRQKRKYVRRQLDEVPVKKRGRPPMIQSMIKAGLFSTSSIARTTPVAPPVLVSEPPAVVQEPEPQAPPQPIVPLSKPFMAIVIEPSSLDAASLAHFFSSGSGSHQAIPAPFIHRTLVSVSTQTEEEQDEDVKPIVTHQVSNGTSAPQELPLSQRSDRMDSSYQQAWSQQFASLKCTVDQHNETLRRLQQEQERRPTQAEEQRQLLVEARGRIDQLERQMMLLVTLLPLPNTRLPFPLPPINTGLFNLNTQHLNPYAEDTPSLFPLPLLP